MANSSIVKRRKLRALEAQRDALLLQKSNAAIKLDQVRAELKHVRKGAA